MSSGLVMPLRAILQLRELGGSAELLWAGKHPLPDQRELRDAAPCPAPRLDKMPFIKMREGEINATAHQTRTNVRFSNSRAIPQEPMKAGLFK